MLTKNDKKLIDEHINAKIPQKIEYVTYIARKKINTGEVYYKEEREKLITRGFKLIKREPSNGLYAKLMLNSEDEETETWEKKYAEGEF